VLLYSSAFLPAVRPLQILLPGIVALSVGRVLANDVAGRGRVMLNNYAGLVTVATNVILNILWIPKYGIAGAALASTGSYTLAFFTQLFLYARLSGNHWTMVLGHLPADGAGPGPLGEGQGEGSAGVMGTSFVYWFERHQGGKDALRSKHRDTWLIS